MAESFEIRPFEECIEKIKYTTKIASQDFKESGRFPIISQEEAFISGYWDNPEDVFHINKPVVIFGDHSRHLKYVDFDFVIGADGVKILSPVKSINAKYFYYFLKWLDIPSLGYSRHYKALKEKSVKVFSETCQQRIVDELDLLSDIIRKKNAQLSDLNALTTAYFYELFGDPVENPRGWIRKRIGDIAHVKIGPFGSLLHKSDYISGGTPLVNPVHMKDLRIVMDNDFTISDSKKQELNNYLLKEGDIVIARRGDIGRCALVTAKDDGYLCGTGSMFVRPAVKIDSLFLVHLLSTKEMVRELLHQAKGVTMLNINCDIISNLSIIVPPIEEQNSYLTKIIALENQKQLILSSIHATELLLNSRSEHYFAE